MRNIQFDESLVGQTIDGGFDLTRWIGAGGMATTYEARQRDLNRKVCIKFLKPEGLSSADSLERFKREARVLSKLKHDYIVSCFSFGLYESIYPFLALELVNGVSLKALAEERPVDWKRACLLVRQLCTALEFAHQRDCIHRDVKPDNVMVTNIDGEETVKLIDFGLVGLQQSEVTVEKLTEPGSIMGSVNYMAPECFKSARPSKSQDIYAVGCVLHYLLSGDIPFAADSPVAVMYKHANEILPALPSHVKPDKVREILEKIIWRATAKAPADRFDNCGEIAAILMSLVYANEENYAPLARKIHPRATSRPDSRLLIPGVSVSLALVVAMLTANWSRVVERLAAGASGPAVHVTSRTVEQVKGEAENTSRTIALLSTLIQTTADLNRLWKDNTSSTARQQQEGMKSTAEFYSKLRIFLRQNGHNLRFAGREVTPAVKQLCRNLTELISAVSSTGDHVLQTDLLNAQCDLVTCAGCYSASLEIVESRKPLPLTFALNSDNLPTLARLHRTIIGYFDQLSNTPLHTVIERLRPAASMYAELPNGEHLFEEFLQRYSACCRSRILKEDWSPEIENIANSMSFSNANDQVEVLWHLADIELGMGKIEQTLQILDSLQKRAQSSGITTERLADKYFEAGHSQPAQNVLNAAISKARLRKNAKAWCRYKIKLAYVLCNDEPRSKRCLEELFQSPQWKEIESQWVSGPHPEEVIETIIAIVQELQHLSSFSFDRKNLKNAQYTLSLSEQLILSRQFDINEYIVNVYYVLQTYSAQNKFNESMKLSKFFLNLVDSHQEILSDQFFQYVARMEVGHRLWLTGRRDEARTYFRDCAKRAPQTIRTCGTGGGVDWIKGKIPWFEQAGLEKEGRSIRQLL